ncbi:MAG: Glucose 1-dehydrogenase B [Candidatus Anoxychlamydiales bacterium]|nr:Glucose 1-dehydrogenase B [Candidatus Anoxychlamydiales bacterium]
MPISTYADFFMNLKSRVALITGSSQGIGKDIAISLLKTGAKVVLRSRREKTLRQLQEKLSKENEEIFYAPGDSTKEADVQEIISKTIKRFGKLDILVNNVGGAIQYGDIFYLNAEDWINAFHSML